MRRSLRREVWGGGWAGREASELETLRRALGVRLRRGSEREGGGGGLGNSSARRRARQIYEAVDAHSKHCAGSSLHLIWGASQYAAALAATQSTAAAAASPATPTPRLDCRFGQRAARASHFSSTACK